MNEQKVALDWPGPGRPQCPRCPLTVLPGQPCITYPDGTVIHEGCLPDETTVVLNMLRASALAEVIQEAQKERQSVGAYKRMRKALSVLGIDDPIAVDFVLERLEYHGPAGAPFPWLASKLKEKKR